MREGRFIETKKETTNTFIERTSQYDSDLFDKDVFDYRKVRQNRRSLMGAEGDVNDVRKANPEQKKIIKAVIIEAEIVFNQYSSRAVRLSPSNILLMSREGARKRYPNIEKNTGGFCDTKGIVYLVTFPGITRSHLGHMLAHELTHLAGFNRFRAVQKDNGEPGFINDRNGIEIGNPQKGMQEDLGGYKYFHALNEAITEKIAIIISKRIKDKTNILDEDFKMLDEMFGPEKKPENFVLRKKEQDETIENGAFAMSNFYPALVHDLERACEELYKKNQERFGSAEDVFRVFAEAYFSGKLLTLARLIEKTYGDGMFRNLSKYRPEDYE